MELWQKKQKKNPTTVHIPHSYLMADRINTRVSTSFDSTQHVIRGMKSNTPTLPMKGLFGTIRPGTKPISSKGWGLHNVSQSLGWAWWRECSTTWVGGVVHGWVSFMHVAACKITFDNNRGLCGLVCTIVESHSLLLEIPPKTTYLWKTSGEFVLW